MKEHFLNGVKKLRTPELIKELNDIKDNGKKAFAHEDWIWRSLITSFCTLGRVPPDGVIPRVQVELYWEKIKGMNEKDVANILQKYNIRFHKRKAKWLLENRELLVKKGLLKFKNKWKNESIDDAIKMLMQFAGISHKYARNIGMDAADCRFENSAAIDSRVYNILLRINPKLPNPCNTRNYLANEMFLRGLAKEIGISPWELDRIIFWQYKKIIPLFQDC